MIDKKNINAVFVDLKINDQQALYVMLASDGSVQRMGRGTIDNTEIEMFTGTSADQLFASLMLDVDDSILQYAGSYHDRSFDGGECQLKLLFQSNDDSTGFEFVYGTNSQGPPTEICDFIITCVDLTDPWYERQLSQIGQ